MNLRGKSLFCVNLAKKDFSLYPDVAMTGKKEETNFTLVLHFRRCHVCGTVNEVENQALLKCTNCGRSFAPFYFFDENMLDGLSDDGFYFSVWKKASTYNPIWGWSTYWLG